MEYPCVLVRLHEDGKVEVDKDLYLDYEGELNVTLNGYLTLLLEREFHTDIYIVGHTPGICQAYLEGFLVGRSIDYISRKDLLAEKDYQMLVQSSFSKLRAE
jgi:hypothetical protein